MHFKAVAISSPIRSLLCKRSVAAALCVLGASFAHAQSPVTTCDAAGIGSLRLVADGLPVTIESVSAATAGTGTAVVPYCLVKVLVPKAIRIWVGLPMSGKWNGRWQSLGGGGYVGSTSLPASAVLSGYAGATTDTGHTGGRPDLPVPILDGSFGMLAPGVPNVPLQVDFAWRSEHSMAVIGKQLVRAFYGRTSAYSYWNGCSTGGRQGLRMAQDFPGDYDGVLAGAPAIHWDRFQAGQIWYQLVQLRDNSGPIGGGDPATLRAKEMLATRRAIAACDALDGVIDGVLTDPRECGYSASADAVLTTEACAASDPTCLTPTEASAIDKMWNGPVSCAKKDRDGECRVPDVATRLLFGKGDKRLWYPNERGTDLGGLGGATPFPIATEQPKFWVYFDPGWDWHTLDYDNYLRFFKDSVARVGPLMASDDPNLARFRNRGGKVIMWHGFADQLIVPAGTIDYYDAVTRRLGGGYQQTQKFARLFMAPGVGHCGGGEGPQPNGLFEALVSWVEQGKAPDRIVATKTVGGTTQSRPLCPYPAFARWTGAGSSDDAANFVCRASFGRNASDGEDAHETWEHD
jgi:hypothetical protein